MENDSTNTTSTDGTNKSILSRTSQFIEKHKTLIKNFRRTLNLTLILSILYYVKTSNIAMDTIPPVVDHLKDLVLEVGKLGNISKNL